MWLSAHRQPKNPCHQCWIIDPVLIWGINDFSRIIGTSPLVQRREWACCSAQSCTHWRLWIQAPAFTLAWILFDMDTDRNQIRHLKTFLSGDQCFSVKRAIKSGLSALLLSPSWLLLTTSSLLHTSVDENKVALIQSYTKKKKKKFLTAGLNPTYITFDSIMSQTFASNGLPETTQLRARTELKPGEGAHVVPQRLCCCPNTCSSEQSHSWDTSNQLNYKV